MRRWSFVAALGCLVGTYMPANAAVLGTQTVSFTNQTTELNGSPALTLNLFNGTSAGQTAGTLQEVQISFSASLSASGTVRNVAGQAQTFTVSVLGSQFDLMVASGGPSALQNYADPNSGSPASLSAFFGQTVGTKRYVSLASNASSAFGTFTTNATAALADFTSVSDVASFVGGGTFSLQPFTSIATSIAGGGGNVVTNITELASASVTLTYLGTVAVTTPAAVSEPATLLLVGIGLVGLAVIRRAPGRDDGMARQAAC